MDERIVVSEDELKRWISNNPDYAAEFLADALDAAADSWGKSIQGRLARVVATEARKLQMLILGIDELFAVSIHANPATGEEAKPSG